jgi:lipoprotein signal peptidase
MRPLLNGGTLGGLVNRFGALFLLIAVDLVSKAVAYVTLSSDETLVPESSLQFILALNRSGEGSWLRSSLEHQAAARIPVFALAYLSLAIAVLVVRRVYPVSRPLLVYGTAFCWPLVLAHFIWPHGFTSVPRSLCVTSAHAAGAFLFFVCWFVSSSTKWRRAWRLLAAAGLGNVLSMLLPPFAVVDFVYSKYVHAVFGLAIFNFADVYFEVGLILIVLTSATSCLRWLRQQMQAARAASDS